jgi:malate dehydrogenase (quinone)
MPWSVRTRRSRPAVDEHYDALLIGAGIMSATMATLLARLEPEWRLCLVERLDGVALESTDAWNNAGTGHAGLCEFNYTPQTADGDVDVSKARVINEQFQVSRQFWAHLVETGVVGPPESFVHPVPHMSFGKGARGVAYLRKRYERLADDPLFAGMRMSEDPTTLADWLPLMFQGRPAGEPVAVSRSDRGTDVDYGSLTRQMVHALTGSGTQVHTGEEVVAIRRSPDGGWLVRSRNRDTRRRTTRSARFVFVGAGGGTLPLLQMTGIPEAREYAGFPISGQFYCTDVPEVVAGHHAKVYGAAAEGAPPLSVPHLDARHVDGRSYLLFGPYAAFSPRLLKRGRNTDLVRSITRANIGVLLRAAWDNRGLVGYLVKQVVQSDERRFAALREFVPSADRRDWRLITAGQRVQVMKRVGRRGEILGFGTEAVIAHDRSLAGLLGSSPGASSAPSVMLEVLGACFPDREEAWADRLRAMIPSHGRRLGDDPDLLGQLLADTDERLGLAGLSASGGDISS